MNAVSHACTILSWQENLSKDEIPPDWMNPFDDLLEEWFDRVEKDRREKYGLNDPDDEMPSLDDNEYARGLR